MTRLEDLLRDSLSERANDVRATPDLWDRVEARTTARTRRTMVFAAAGTAMAVGAAAFVVPGLLDRTPERPAILIDPSPSDAPTPAESREPDGGALQGIVDPVGTHAVAVVDGMIHWYDLDSPDTNVLAFAAPFAYPADIAVRPRPEADGWTVAYIAEVQGQWQLRMLTIADDALRSGGRVEVLADNVVDAQPVLAGSMVPGVAWSPDGAMFAWLEHRGGAAPRSVVQVFDASDPLAPARVAYCCEPGGLLAEGALVGQFALSDWTWDNTYEDGLEGRFLFAGVGRSWQSSLTLDPDGSIQVGGLDPIDVAADFDAAGPASGPLALRIAGLAPGEIFAVDRLLDGERLLAWSDTGIADIQTDFADLASAGDHLVVSWGGQLFLRSPERAFRRQTDATVGAVDVATTPWSAPFVNDEGEVVTGGATPAAPQPAHGLRAVNGELQVIEDWFGEGDPQIVRGIGSPPAFEGPAPIRGVTVRPGSTIDDLEAVVLVLNEGTLEFWTVRSTEPGPSVVWEQFGRQYQPLVPADDQLLPIPVFSDADPGGDRYLAWVDHEGDNQALRVIGWTDGSGPGTNSTATDNTSFAIPGNQRMQLDGWRWSQRDIDGWTAAELTFTASGGDGQVSALLAGVGRGADGAISLDDDCFCGEPGHGSHTHEAVRHEPSSWSWQLSADADGISLSGWRDGAPDAVRPTLPRDLAQHPEPTRLELRAWGDTAVVLDPVAQTAWVVREGALDSFDAEAFDFLD